MFDGTVFQQEWVGIGLCALAAVIAFWLLKNIIKWLLILAIVGFAVWYFWLA